MILQVCEALATTWKLPWSSLHAYFLFLSKLLRFLRLWKSVDLRRTNSLSLGQTRWTKEKRKMWRHESWTVTLDDQEGTAGSVLQKQQQWAGGGWGLELGKVTEGHWNPMAEPCHPPGLWARHLLHCPSFSLLGRRNGGWALQKYLLVYLIGCHKGIRKTANIWKVVGLFSFICSLCNFH